MSRGRSACDARSSTACAASSWGAVAAVVPLVLQGAAGAWSYVGAGDAPARRRGRRRATGLPAEAARRRRRRGSPTAATDSRIASPPRSSGPIARIAPRSWTRSWPTPCRARRAARPRGGSSRAACRARRKLRPGPARCWASCWRWRRRSRCPQGGLPNFSVARDEDEEKLKERGGRPRSSRSARRPPSAMPVQRADVQERDLDAARGRRRRQSQPGDLSAVFKDTSLAGRSARLQLLPQEGRRAAADARADRPAARSPARLHAEPDQDGLPEGQGAARRPRPG